MENSTDPARVGSGGLASPLGGALVDRTFARDELAEAARAARRAVRLGANAVSDLELLGSGAYSPLTGFMTSADYHSVVDHAQLHDGTPWTLPITLPAPDDLAHEAREGEDIALHGPDGSPVGILTVAEVFERDPEREARDVYRTTDQAHPGVAALLAASRLLVAGEVRVVSRPAGAVLSGPRETRAELSRRGWNSVVAFQTRNPIHRAHEHLTKVALELVDGLLVHPLSGMTKDDDVPFDVRMRCYRALLDRYYPKDRAVLGVFPASMRYAGPREAVYHGLVRRNYGCSHFIIGRDAAGVGSYYGPYDAQTLYDELGGAERLGFVAVKFEHAFFCRRCEGMASTRTCPHPQDAHVTLSGTRMRDLLRRGQDLPREITRPEVAAILQAAYANGEVPGAQ